MSEWWTRLNPSFSCKKGPDYTHPSDNTLNRIASHRLGSLARLGWLMLFLAPRFSLIPVTVRWSLVTFLRFCLPCARAHTTHYSLLPSLPSALSMTVASKNTPNTTHTDTQHTPNPHLASSSIRSSFFTAPFKFNA